MVELGGTYVVVAGPIVVVAMATLSTFEPTPVTKIKPPADTEQTRKIRIVQCQNCGMLVVPKGNGKCPSCQTEISIES